MIDFHASRPLVLWPFIRLGWPHFGWAGVDIFFVLSGFLVGGLLVKEWKVRGSIQRKRFLVRRGFKIWPQYYVFLLLTLVLGKESVRQLWGNFLNIQNYTGGIPHTWTLALEEHAYLLLVFLLAFAAARGARVRSAFIGVAALAAGVVAWRFLLASRGVDTQLRTDTRVDGILYGLLLAMVYHFAPGRFQRLQQRWPLLLAVLSGGLLYLRLQLHTWWDAPLQYLLMDACGVAVLLLLYRRHTGVRHGWLYRAVAWIGVYSYGIYLWHLAVLVKVIALARHLHGTPATAVLLLLPFALAIVVGVVATKLVEFPAVALRDRLFPKPVDSAVGEPAVLEATTVPAR